MVQLLMSLVLVALLFMSWRSFSWCMVLMFMFMALMWLLQSVIGLAG